MVNGYWPRTWQLPGAVWTTWLLVLEITNADAPLAMTSANTATRGTAHPKDRITCNLL
jgi:hypothetical protein